MGIIEVIVTGPQSEVNTLAEALLEARLVACVQASVIDSQYWWDGSIRRAKEVRLAMHTRQDLTTDIEDFVTQNHPFEVPCVVSVPLQSASVKYAEWVVHSTLAFDETGKSAEGKDRRTAQD